MQRYRLISTATPTIKTPIPIPIIRVAKNSNAAITQVLTQVNGWGNPINTHRQPEM